LLPGASIPASLMSFTPESKRTAMARLSIYSRANVDQVALLGG